MGRRPAVRAFGNVYEVAVNTNQGVLQLNAWITSNNLTKVTLTEVRVPHENLRFIAVMDSSDDYGGAYELCIRLHDSCPVTDDVLSTLVAATQSKPERKRKG